MAPVARDRRRGLDRRTERESGRDRPGPWFDPAVWGERDTGDAVYLHTLAARRNHTGEGIGTRGLAWADGLARERGTFRLRLDYVARLPTLVAFDDAAGFTRAGTARAADSDPILFETIVTPDARPAARRSGPPGIDALV